MRSLVAADAEQALELQTQEELFQGTAQAGQAGTPEPIGGCSLKRSRCLRARPWYRLTARCSAATSAAPCSGGGVGGGHRHPQGQPQEHPWLG